MTLSITIKEKGRGRGSKTTFASLSEAQDFIRGYWQGREYQDGPAAFHSDYATFKLTGFKLSDVMYTTWEDGYPYSTFKDSTELTPAQTELNHPF